MLYVCRRPSGVACHVLITPGSWHCKHWWGWNAELSSLLVVHVLFAWSGETLLDWFSIEPCLFTSTYILCTKCKETRWCASLVAEWMCVERAMLQRASFV